MNSWNKWMNDCMAWIIIYYPWWLHTVPQKTKKINYYNEKWNGWVILFNNMSVDVKWRILLTIVMRKK